MNMDFARTVATYELSCITHYSRGYDGPFYTPSGYLADIKREYDRWIHIKDNTWDQTKDQCLAMAEASGLRYAVFYGREIEAATPDSPNAEWLDWQAKARAGVFTGPYAR